MKAKKTISLLLTTLMLFACDSNNPSSSETVDSSANSSIYESSGISSTTTSSSSEFSSSWSLESSMNSSNSMSSELSSSNSSDSSSSNSSDSSSSEVVVPISERQQILNQLYDATEAENFTILMKSSTNRRSSEIFTNSYISKGSSQDGYVLLNDIENKKDKMVYKFDFEEDNIILKHAEVKNENGHKVAQRTMENLIPLNTYKGKSNVFEPLIERDSEGLMSTDSALIYTLAELLGYESYAEQGDFPIVRLYLDTQKQLSFTLQSTPDYISLTDFATGTFTNIGTSSDSRVENFINAPTFYDAIREEMLQPLLKDGLSMISNVYMNYLDDGSKELVGYSNVDTSSTCLNINIEDFGDSSVSKLHVVPNENNMAAKVFLNAKNELEYEQTSTKWSDVHLPKDFLNAKSFYKIENNVYRYYGTLFAEIFDCMAYVTLNDIESFDLIVSNNKVVAAVFTFENSQDMMGNAMYYSVETSLFDFENPNLPEILEKTKDTPVIQESIDHLNFDTSYTVKMYDVRQPQIYTTLEITKNAVLKKEVYPRPGEVDVYDSKTTGYVLLNDQSIIPISVDNNNVVKASGDPIYNMTLQELLGFNVSANVFYDFPNDSYYGLRADIYKIYEHMFGGSNLKNYNYDTFVMLYDENHYITTIKYGYLINGMVTGNEQIDIMNYGTTIIDESILSQIDNLEKYEEPITWKDEEQVWNQLVERFGEDVAKLVPYLYDETLSAKWSAFYTSKMFCITVESLGLNEDPTDYMNRYIQLLRESDGFVEDIDANGNTIFVYGTQIEIFVDSSPCRGIYISVVE